MLPVNLGTGLDLHGVHILIYNLVSKIHAFEITVAVRRHMYASYVWLLSLSLTSIQSSSYKRICFDFFNQIKPS